MSNNHKITKSQNHKSQKGSFNMQNGIPYNIIPY